MTRQITVVLPAYNEELALARLFDRFAEVQEQVSEPLHILVVDDGSQDNTAGVAQGWQGRPPVELIQFPMNRGYGAALGEGVAQAAQRSSDDDLILTMDADDTHPPVHLREMLTALDTHQLEVVIASRYAPGGEEIGVPWHRRLLSRGAGWVYRFVFRLPEVKDYSCGYRLFRAHTIKSSIAQHHGLDLDSGFQATGQLLLYLREQTDRIGEVGFHLHYERKPTASKMKKLATVWGTLRFLNRVRKTIRLIEKAGPKP